MSKTKYRFTYDEVRVIVIALVELKNQLIAEGRYTDAVDELLVRFVDQRCFQPDNGIHCSACKCGAFVISEHRNYGERIRYGNYERNNERYSKWSRYER